jgi:hypothetical protein
LPCAACGPVDFWLGLAPVLLLLLLLSSCFRPLVDSSEGRVRGSTLSVPLRNASIESDSANNRPDWDLAPPPRLSFLDASRLLTAPAPVPSSSPSPFLPTRLQTYLFVAQPVP